MSSSTQKSEALAAEGAGFAEFGRSRLERWIDSLDGEGLARLRWGDVKRLRERADAVDALRRLGRPPLRLILGGRR